jgi:hypothetical protein
MTFCFLKVFMLVAALVLAQATAALERRLGRMVEAALELLPAPVQSEVSAVGVAAMALAQHIHAGLWDLAAVVDVQTAVP